MAATNSEIKFVYFDMGKVLLEFDHQKMINQVAALVEKPADVLRGILLEQPHDIENRYELGELNCEQFHRLFCELVGVQVDREKLLLAISDIFQLNTSIVHLLSQLRAFNFPMAILSNTCQAHWEYAQHEFAAVGSLFEHRVLSYEEQSMKPDRKIYDSAIRLANKLTGCNANEIFFTDDRMENVEAAREAGIQAELYQSSRELGKQLQAAGVPVVL